MLVLIFLFVNFIFLILAFMIIVSDIMKGISKKPTVDDAKTPSESTGINKRGYLFGILSLIIMVFLSLNYIG